jgi:hypothetical protein
MSLNILSPEFTVAATRPPVPITLILEQIRLSDRAGQYLALDLLFIRTGN